MLNLKGTSWKLNWKYLDQLHALILEFTDGYVLQVYKRIVQSTSTGHYQAPLFLQLLN